VARSYREFGDGSVGAEYIEEMEGPLTFSRMLRAVRLADEVTQVEFSRRLGITKAYLCDIERGRRSVSPEKAAEFAHKLGYGPEVFIQLALQAELDKADLPFRVKVEAA
jgi:transcriptional regulator with XRE-family HTH domain